jgi:pimeloyl-ACP methyl ester carboxylesterase
MRIERRAAILASGTELAGLERLASYGHLRRLCIVILACTLAGCVASRPLAYGPDLQGFDYPYPVRLYSFKTQAQTYAMAYMDVAPAGATPGSKPRPGAGRTVVLLHGADFCGATWGSSIEKLHEAGFRVVVPDQLAFCKSSKPINYQFSFQQLATSTRELLGRLGVGEVILVGHGMGGMLAVRYALMYPNGVSELVLVDPLGLEDWKAKGVLYLTIDERYALELQNTPARLKQYELENYYAGHWRSEYDIWLRVLAGFYLGPGRERFAWNQALTFDMIFTQPVVYELGELRMPTVLIIGELDRTVPFRSSAPPAVSATLGQYPELGRLAAQRIPHCRLIELAGVGHVPQIEAPERFNEILLQGIENPPAAPAAPSAPASR